MRDLFVFGSISVLMLAALRKPQVGILAWIWVTVMNPHRSASGFMYDFPINDLVAIVTILSCIINWEKRNTAEFLPILKWTIIFFAWATLTTIFSVDFLLAFTDWEKFTKTLLLFCLTLLFMNRKHWIIAAIAVYILSIGFYGVKGGLFTILTGGAYRVWGPYGTTWYANNSVCIAMLMAMPLCIAFRHVLNHRVLKLAAIFTAFCMFIAIFGTQSRGGLVGLLGMGLVMVLRSRRKFLVLFVISIMFPAAYISMPAVWKERMSTIQSYEEDASASNRVIQWYYAIDIANQRPLFGNGFDAFFHQPYYRRFVAEKDANRAVHSNYFQVLGEQGYIGLLMYLTIMGAAFFSAGRWCRNYPDNEETRWASSLLEMSQFSIAGYAFNGLTINVAYMDLYWLVVAFVVLLISYKSGVVRQASSVSSGAAAMKERLAVAPNSGM